MFSFPIPHFGLTRNQVSISANTQDYNLADVLGNPTKLVRVVLTIDTGVEVTSSDSTIFAFDTGSLPAGSQLKIINKGTFRGTGGDAGRGGDINNGANLPGSAGNDGGDAMNLQLDVSLDNTNGNILAGGGGGGGGGAGHRNAGATDCHSGGGGGGGAGSDVGAAAGAGSATNCTFITNGSGGTAGTTTTGGIGGAGATPHGSTCVAGRGGDGGNIAEFGQAGVGATGCNFGNSPGGNGGEPGKAINLNGNTVTFLGGNTPARVKGNVT